MLTALLTGHLSAHEPAASLGHSRAPRHLNEVAVGPFAGPLGSFMLTPSEVALLTFARSVAIRDCMARAGQTYRLRGLPKTARELAESETNAARRLYGLSDRTAASRSGYLPASDPTPEPSSRTLSDGAMRALFGEEDGSHDASARWGGCAAAADRTIGNDIDISPFGRARDLWLTVDRELRVSWEYRSVVADWSECMRSRGYDVTDPVEYAGRIAEAMSRLHPVATVDFSHQRAIAVADVDCKQRTRFVARAEAKRAALERAILRSNSVALNADRRRLHRQLAVARHFLTQAGYST